MTGKCIALPIICLNILILVNLVLWQFQSHTKGDVYLCPQATVWVRSTSASSLWTILFIHLKMLKIILTRESHIKSPEHIERRAILSLHSLQLWIFRHPKTFSSFPRTSGFLCITAGHENNWLSWTCKCWVIHHTGNVRFQQEICISHPQ